MLTEEQKKKYLENSNSCPHCDSDDLTIVSKDSDYNQAWHGIKCESCDRRWTDIYTLTDVEDDDEYDGTEGQDRENYTDDQDRENYTIED